MLKKSDNNNYTIPEGEKAPVRNCCSKIRSLYVSHLNIDVNTFELDTKYEDENYVMVDLRESYYHINKNDYDIAGKCREIIFWDNHTKYCSVCGQKLIDNTEISKICLNCNTEVWPNLSIAVIVLVRKNNMALLVKANNPKRDYYGLVAGFVETGETLEDTVIREVKEETGISIKNIEYFASQPWPYPCGLMVAFNAEYLEGDIVIQEEEISDAQWFSVNALPLLPAEMSIARHLIDNWIKNNNYDK